MPREYRSSFTCAEPGCRDVQFLVSSTRRDQADVYPRQKERPYRCSRHADPDRNLRPGNETTRSVLVASRVRAWPSRYDPEEGPPWLKGLFWLEEGTERAGSGYTHGPGFNAHASDFPEGTRLVVTAEILPPAAEKGGDGDLETLS